MKNAESMLKKKIPTAIYAMASSILTELILDFLTESTYSGQYSNGHFKIISQSNFSTLHVIAIGIVIFCVIWVCFCVIVPLLLSLLTRLTFRPFRKFRRVDVVSTYNSVRDNVVKIAEILSNEKLTHTNREVFMFVDLIKSSKRLTTVFVTPENKRRLFHRSYFRSCVTIDDIERYVSPYEFSALITLMIDLLTETYKSCPKGSGANADLCEAKERLGCLQEAFTAHDQTL